MGFRNKVVLVTGASSGIGAAVAVALSAANANVIMVGRNQIKLSAVAARCNNPLVIIADVTKDDDVQRIIDQTIKKFGKLDILINSAGLAVIGKILDGTMMRAFDIVMNTNVRGLVHMTTVAAPYLVKTKGNIVNVSSVAGLITQTFPGTINYCISKATVTHFGVCAASELAPHGVRVNTVSPGPVNTDFITNGKLPFTLDYAKSKNCLNRYSEPEEIADVILFLASDKAKGITGSNFLCDNELPTAGCIATKLSATTTALTPSFKRRCNDGQRIMEQIFMMDKSWPTRNTRTYKLGIGLVSPFLERRIGAKTYHAAPMRIDKLDLMLHQVKTSLCNVLNRHLFV